MISILCQEHRRKIGACVTFSGCFISKCFNSSKKIDDFFTPPPGSKESISIPEISALLRSSASPDPSITSSLVLKYPKDNLQQILKAVLEA